ncbi:MAG: substrate-binding domain-containing protein [Butyricicoccus sp.]
MKKRGCLLLVLALWLTSCGEIHQTVEQPKYTIGVVLKAMNSQYWMEIRSGMEQAASELGVDLLLLAPQDEKAEREQAEHIRNLLNNGVDALLVAPCNSYNTAWFVELAQEKNIPILTVDTRALDSELPYIGADNENIGRMAAKYFAERLPKGARIAVLSGSSKQSTHTARVAAFLDEIHTMNCFAAPAVYYTDGEFSQGYEQARSLTDVDALFCTSAILGLGAVTAQAQQTEAACPIVAVDTQDDAIEAVRSGAMDALITQPGQEIGHQAMKIALDLLEEKEIPEETLLTGRLLTRDNIDDTPEREE